jgi:hypothetical protein
MLGALASCRDYLNGGAACPTLCPGASVVVRDTEFDGATVLSMDTTVTGYSPFSSATEVLVAVGANTTPQNTIDVRGIIRFDSLTTEWDTAGTDVAATFAESVYVRFWFDTLLTKSPANGPITVSAYDVDSAGIDTTTVALAALYTPARFLGSQTFVPGSRAVLTGPQIDSLTIYLDSTKIVPHLTGDHLVRIGLRITSAGPAWLDIIRETELGTDEPAFSYRPTPDSTVSALVNAPNSLTPAGDTTLQEELAEYSVTVVGTGAPLPGYLTVGGLPASRSYFLFTLPVRIVDSTTVVRATMTLTHLASPLFPPLDTMFMFGEGVLSTGVVTDPGKNALFVAPSTLIGIDSTRVFPGVADTVNVEFVNAIRVWSKRGIDTVQRVIVLTANEEGATPYVASFYSAAPGVPVSLHPHIHIAYVNPVNYPLP